MQKARRHTFQPEGQHSATTACKRVVSGPFNSPSGVLFIFRSRYFSLSVAREYLALGDGPPGFKPGFT